MRRHRAVVRAANRGELVDGLAALVDDDEHPLVARSSKSIAPYAAFVFPGQGNQWQSMGADAYRRLPAYRAEADRCAEAFVAAGLSSPLPYLQGDEAQEWSRTQIQGAQFVHAVSLASQWRFCGVLPDIAIGHSLGEDRGRLCGRQDLVIRCGCIGRCARSGRRPADRPLRHGSARHRGRRGERADRRRSRPGRRYPRSTHRRPPWCQGTTTP